MKTLLVAILIAMGPNDGLPELTVRTDDTVITTSCRVVIPGGTIIEDQNNNGVIQIGASNIVVEFADGSVLRGAEKTTRPDEYRGYGIVLKGHAGVTIRGAKVRGYFCGIRASHADELTIENADASDCRRAHLKSTPVAEDTSDWLSPHDNDGNEWLTRYGSAMYIEDSDKVTVRRCRVRNGQNGLCLDRVSNARIYDNDFSFLSGWGIALWRSNRNVISRNAVDFCVRGYSHGVYNRGQDSAGILVFEQCCDNVFAENSATHGGDGFFGFAGREALGETPAPRPDFDYRRRGSNDNLLVNNDFSYAAAHGIEMTFSFGNRFVGNRLVGNAICGIWGGYSQDTLIAGNVIEENGEMGYGLERGGVNIEHGRDNRVIYNKFKKNKCAVHLWWDEEGDFAKKPWGLANGTASTGNLVARNEFVGDALMFCLRGPSNVTIGPNTSRAIGRQLERDKDSQVVDTEDVAIEPFEMPAYAVYGETRPVGARNGLRGRENIIMTEWEPWDHESPLIRMVEATGMSHAYEFYKMPGRLAVSLRAEGAKGRLTRAKTDGRVPCYVVSANEAGVHPYTLKVSAGDYNKEITGMLVAATWDVTFFKWTKDVDPREDLDGWRELARRDEAVWVQTDQLRFKYAFAGPSDLGLSSELTRAALGGDSFGMIARTNLPLGKGRWNITTLSDDGVRVTVDGVAIIDDWTWHTPKRDEGILELPSKKTVEIVVEHFEIDGYATLEFDLAPAN
ncbi:MAG: right-handed parallel beta-helix repeat-containing protein [Phycisphaerae bacterium]|nr:right-handed parallel beta-helix repeat-containing protein [Phycisphaerae bacterium]